MSYVNSLFRRCVVDRLVSAVFHIGVKPCSVLKVWENDLGTAVSHEEQWSQPAAIAELEKSSHEKDHDLADEDEAAYHTAASD